MNYRYEITPQIFLLKKYSDIFFSEILARLDELGYRPKIGIESEFYIRRAGKGRGGNGSGNGDDENDGRDDGTDGIAYASRGGGASREWEENLYSEIYEFCRKNNIDLDRVKREEGEGQFELEFSPYTDLHRLIKDFRNIKSFLINSPHGANFKAKPFYGDVGSALQINLSLIDMNDNNLFGKNSGDSDESPLLLMGIGGLLEKTNELLPLLVESEECIFRYNVELNRLYFSRGKIPAPTCNSWGINNRSCSIRIPIAKRQNSREEFEMETRNNRRLEFRVPSADADIKFVILTTLYGMLYGIENKLTPPPPTSNNVLEEAWNYEAIAVTN